MKIRGKLLTLILIPLLAVSTAAVWGFRDQSVRTELAEDAQALAERAASTHRVAVAYAAERLALYGELSAGEIADLQAETDAALESAGLAPDAVQAARAETERAAAADLYSEAIAELLPPGSEISDAYESGQLLTSIAIRSSFDFLHAREAAWFDYIETSELMAGGAENMSLVPVAVALSESSTLANTAAAAIAQQDEPSLLAASGSEAERAMDNLAFLATNEMASGTTGISTAEIVEGLTAARAEWNAALTSADTFLLDATQGTLDDANGVRSLFSLLGVVGMVVLAGLVFVIYRSITHPLENLVTRARSVAQDELPELVRTLRSDEEFDDLPEPMPIPVTNNDEIGELVEAFNEVQFTAHELATEQALGRKNVAEMFVNLGRRNQQLLERILGLLTDLERDEEDPDTLRDLFVLDNVVTRMRRNAESLLVLAGGQTPRQWSNPVSLEDTVRSALSEVEGYERIDIAALAEVRIPGSVVADVAHLLAELIENAVSFSDPSTQVLVGGHFESDGYLITIFDQGIGMTEEELESNNRRIVDPPPLDQAPTKFLGLFVVGRLADRHGIRVRLAKAPGRGIMARVLIPNATLIVDDGVDTTPSDDHVADSAVISATEAALNAGEMPEIHEVDDIEVIHDIDVLDEPADVPAIDAIGADEFDRADFDEVEPEVAPVADEVAGLDEAMAEVGTDEAPEPLPVRGATDATIDEPLPVRGATDAVTDPVETSTDSVERSTDTVEASADSVEASTDSVEASTDSVEASTDSVEASTEVAEPLPMRGASDLPVRTAGATMPEPEDPAAELPTRRSTDDALPTRVRGDALGDDVAEEPAPQPEQREAVGEEAAGSFSSMMSAFSTGVSRGLEETATDSLDEGNER